MMIMSDGPLSRRDCTSRLPLFSTWSVKGYGWFVRLSSTLYALRLHGTPANRVCARVLSTASFFSPLPHPTCSERRKHTAEMPEARQRHKRRQTYTVCLQPGALSPCRVPCLI